MPRVTHTETVTRETQQADVIYVDTSTTPWPAFVSPDGIGRLHYSTVAEAMAEHGEDLPVVYVEYVTD